MDNGFSSAFEENKLYYFTIELPFGSFNRNGLDLQFLYNDYMKDV